MSMEKINEILDELLNLLRTELEEYGQLLCLVNEQQTHIMNKDMHNVSLFIESIEYQVNKNLTITRKREKILQTIAELFSMDKHTRLSHFLTSFPKQYQMQFQALIDEITNLVEKVKHKAQQNQLLLARHCEISEQFIHAVNPGSCIKLYSRKGLASNTPINLKPMIFAVK